MQGDILNDSQSAASATWPVLSPSQNPSQPVLPISNTEVVTTSEQAAQEFIPSPTRPETVRVWGTDFSRLTMSQAVDLADEIIRLAKPEYFVTANLNYLMLTEDCPALANVNRRAAAILADGHPIVARSRLGSNPLPGRVAGADLVVELARLAATRGHRIFFLGGAPGVAQSAADELQRRLPKLQVAGCLAPPFRNLTAAEHSQMLDDIRATGPDILLVAFGQPKGEIWVYDNFVELGVPLNIQIGASFDFLAGTARRSPQLWQKVGCEWLFRALSDPKRLVPRYTRNALFLIRQVLSEVVCGRVDKHLAR